MSTTTRTSSTGNTTQPTKTTTRTKTEHYSVQTNTSQEQDRRITRSIAAHLCITISWCGPASGRPQNPPRAVDLAGGWSSC